MKVYFLQLTESGKGNYLNPFSASKCTNNRMLTKHKTETLTIPNAHDELSGTTAEDGYITSLPTKNQLSPPRKMLRSPFTINKDSTNIVERSPAKKCDVKAH